MSTILLIDNDNMSNNLKIENSESFYLSNLLTKNGYEVVTSSFSDEGYRLLETNNFDIAILNCFLNDLSEIEFCKNIAEKKIMTLILFISSVTGVEYKVMCLDSGADDYIVKPFDERELIARIKALERRICKTEEVLKIDDLTVNVLTRVVKRSGKLIDLTAREYALLLFLLRNKGKKLSRMDISQNVWGIDFDTGTNLIDVYIKYLREKLNINNKSNQLIHTVYGYGYIMDIKEQSKR